MWLNPHIHPIDAHESIDGATLNTQLYSITAFRGCDNPNHTNSISIFVKLPNRK